MAPKRRTRKKRADAAAKPRKMDGNGEEADNIEIVRFRKIRNKSFDTRKQIAASR